MGNPQRRAKGFNGWIGEMQQSPAYAALQKHRARLAAAGLTDADLMPPTTTSVPKSSGALPSTPAAAAAPGSAALPSTSSVTGGPAPARVTSGPPPTPPAALSAQSLPAFPMLSASGMLGPSQLGMTGTLTAPATSTAAYMRQRQAPTQPGPAQQSQFGSLTGVNYAGGGTPTEASAPAGGPPTAGQPQGGPPAPEGAGAAVAAPAGPPQPVTAGPPLVPPPSQLPGGIIQSGLSGGATKPVGMTAPPPRVRTRLFQTPAEQQESQMRQEISGIQRLLYEQGDPDWQEKGVQFVLSQYSRSGVAKAARPYQKADGSWWLPIYDSTGNVVNEIPTAAPSTLSSRAANPNELAAHGLYARPGESPKETFDRISREPDGAAKVQNAVKRAQFVVSQKPLTPQEKFNDRMKLTDDWMQYSKNHQEMTAQMGKMRVAWESMQKDPSYIPSGSEMIITTFERMLDPESVVRETEARRPGTMQPWLDRIPQWMQQIRNGGAYITVEALQYYVKLAEQIYSVSQQTMMEERARIDRTAKEFDLGPIEMPGYGSVPNPNPEPLADPNAPPAPATTGPPPSLSFGSYGSKTPAASPAAGSSRKVGDLDTPLEIDPVTGRFKQ